MVSQKAKRSSAAPLIALGVGAVALIGLLGFAVYQDQTNAAKQPPAAAMESPKTGSCWHTPVKPQIAGLEFVECKTSNDHVAEGQKVTYETDPPLSGPHWGGWLQPGFYTSAQTAERLVHDLEHGNVVIYYDKTKLSDAEMDALKALPKKFNKDFQGVIAVPREDAKHAIILTAWENALRLEKFDQGRVDQFVDAFRGRGPENPVR